MDFEKVKQSLDRISLSQYVKFIAENNGNTCDKCRQHHGKVFEKNDSEHPALPIHPNCRCEYQNIPISATQTQEITSFVFDYSFERQGQQNQGGLPQGVYSIRCQETGSLVKGNIKKHFIGTISWGHFHWKLIPDKLTDMRGRKTDSFTIHGGNIPTSGGCIDLTGEDVKLKKYLDSTAKQFPAVYVRYDSEKIIYTKRQLRYADFFLPGN